MIKPLAKHIEEKLPIWIASIIFSGFLVVISGIGAYIKSEVDRRAGEAELRRDLDLILCKLDLAEEGTEICRWTTTIVEDLDKVVPAEPPEE